MGLIINKKYIIMPKGIIIAVLLGIYLHIFFLLYILKLKTCSREQCTLYSTDTKMQIERGSVLSPAQVEEEDVKSMCHGTPHNIPFRQ